MPEAERRLAAILSADVVGYSRLMADDEDATVRGILELRSALAGRVTEHGGRVVDAPGDNLLAELPSALEAVRCAWSSASASTWATCACTTGGSTATA